jgi:hypothetical protein
MKRVTRTVVSSLAPVAVVEPFFDRTFPILLEFQPLVADPNAPGERSVEERGGLGEWVTIELEVMV